MTDEVAELFLTPGERARGVGVDSVMFTMDWTGEDHPGALAAFAADRVRAFGAEPTGVDTEASDTEAFDAGGVDRAVESDPTPRRGDLPVRRLDHLSGVLAELGFTLAVWDDGTDTYELLVAPTGEREPTGLLYRGLPVRPWGAAPEAALVSLDCPDCSQMLVWDLPPAETLADEHCDCGTALFDATGSPLPGVTLYD
ncbi:hypothetical protein [Kitasatospora sp. NPDC096204]|uniref:hypothetical protein n=1 Tax=Kitasatospora sp. NPDC096204 TaxID=3364094 RepID=UPI00380D3942